MLARPELCRIRSGQPGEMPRRLDDRHLHPETDAEIRHLPLARETHRLDFPLRAALAKAPGHEDRVDILKAAHRLLLGLEDLRIDPVELDADVVGDAAMRHRLA